MDALTGFMISTGLPDKSLLSTKKAQFHVLAHFSQLQCKSVQVGESHLDVWGHQDLSNRFHTMPDGSVLVLIGSPVGKIVWQDIQECLMKVNRPEEFELPWDGRVILLQISADGKRWTMWNDWLGSIPVFHAQIGQGRVASTLEPVVVAGAGFTQSDIFIPGLVYLLIHGNFTSDWTLYKTMKVAPPDSLCSWDETGFHSSTFFTVKPTDERWTSGWDELVAEMYELSREAIVEVLKMSCGWILPLSGGLDSRLIAAVGAERGVTLHAYCWGRRESSEVACSQKIARALGIPWKWINIGTDYMVKYSQFWADMFGSSMHFHGMYQMPFYDALKSEPPGPIVSGFLGDTLAGFDVRFQSMFYSSSDHPYQTLPDDWIHWSSTELQGLFKFPVDDALKQVKEEILEQRNALKGPGFQSLRFLTLWGRQRHFTYFQSVLCDYRRGVMSPFLNKAYARFCLSLPRAVLEERRLLGDVFRQYYGILATIPGRYGEFPLISTGRYLFNRRISKLLPDILLRGPFQEFNQTQFSIDVDCVRMSGRSSFWPVFEGGVNLGDWINLNEIDKVYDAAMTGDQKSVKKLQSVQTLAYRLNYEPGIS